MTTLPLILALLTAASGDDVVARVDGAAISSSAIARRRAGFQAQGHALDDAQTLASLVDEAILAAEAERQGLRKDPEVAARLEAERRKAAADAFLEAEVSGGAPPEATLRAMFHASNDFLRYELLAFETQAAAQAAKDRIAKGAALAAEAPAALVARLHPKPADAPWMLRAQLEPGLAEVGFQAAAGALVGPFPIAAGFGIARILEARIGTEAEFAAKRASLEAHAAKQLDAQARAHLALGLRKKAGVKLDEPFLQGLKGLEASPADLDHVVATVGGRPVRYREILPGVKAVAGGAGGGHLAGPSVRLQVAWKVVDARLVEDLALSRGFGGKPEVVARAVEAERNVLAHAVVERILAGAAAPSEAEVQAHYDRNKAAFRRPLAEVRPTAAARAAAEKREAALTARVEELRKKATVSIDDAALARAGARAR